MKWYYTLAGSHVHVRVFMNGGKCGDLCFRLEEFTSITQFTEVGLRDHTEFHARLNSTTVTFINETK